MKKIYFAAILSMFAAAPLANATSLTFDIDGAVNANLISQDYGDFVAATTVGSFHYGSTGGFTPNVGVSYLGSGSQTQLNFWTTGYSDLTNVAEYEPDGESNYKVTFTADPGFKVRIASFDVGNFGGQITVPGVTITNESAQVLFQQSSFVLPASSSPHISFSPDVAGSQLTLTFDLTALGGNSDNVGFDNLVFTQEVSEVPEPASLGILGVGLAALCTRRRRK